MRLYVARLKLVEQGNLMESYELEEVHHSLVEMKKSKEKESRRKQKQNKQSGDQKKVEEKKEELEGSDMEEMNEEEKEEEEGEEESTLTLKEESTLTEESRLMSCQEYFQKLLSKGCFLTFFLFHFVWVLKIGLLF